MSYQAEFFIIDDVGLINLRGTGEVIARFEAVLGLAMPTRPNQVALGKDIAVLSLASDQWWVRTHSCDEQRVFGLLCSAVENLHAAVTIVSDHFTGFSIVGEDARQILRQGMAHLRMMCDVHLRQIAEVLLFLHEHLGFSPRHAGSPHSQGGQDAVAAGLTDGRRGPPYALSAKETWPRLGASVIVSAARRRWAPRPRT